MRLPRLPTWLVRVRLGEPMAEFMLGDLEEQFRADRRSRGVVRAIGRYWRRALGCAWHGRARPRIGVRRLERTRGGPDMHALWRDLVVAIRAAARAPGYTVVVVVTIALAIGANTVLFSIANPLIVRALPVAEPATLGWVFGYNQARSLTREPSSIPDFLEWRAQATAFSSLAAWDERRATLGGHGEPERIVTARATPNLFEIWGLDAREGRLFVAGEGEPSGPTVGVLSYRFWRERFEADRRVIGETYLLDGRPVTVLGVMEPEIELGSLASIDMWIPLPLDVDASRDERSLLVVGRLAPGVDLPRADAEIRAISARQAADHPVTNRDWESRVMPTSIALASRESWIILGLMAVVVSFILLIACASLANLVMARFVSGRIDASVRLALGASRWQLARPVIVENLLLGAIGGLTGLGLAYAGVRAITAVAYEPFLRSLSIDLNVLVFTAALSVLTPVLFSLWPAVSASRAVAAEPLRDVRTSGGRTARRGRHALVAAQVALALSLLVVSSLVVRSMLNLRHSDLGMETDRLLLSRVELPPERYPEPGHLATFARTLASNVRVLPGIESSAVVSHVPAIDPEITRTLAGAPGDTGVERDQPWAAWYAVGPGFLDTVGMPLLGGRFFTAADAAGTAPVIVLNRLAAERYFGGMAGALGRTIRLTDGQHVGPAATIVGIVAGTPNIRIEASPQVFVPLDQSPSRTLALLVRSASPAQAAPEVRVALRQLDDQMAVSTIRPFEAIIDEAFSSLQIINGLFVGFAVLALVLAAAGLYGVISYSVNQRRREIGVRLALGAEPRSIRRLVLADGLRVTSVGAAIGLLLALLLGRASRSVLTGVEPGDPVTLAAVTAVIFLVAVGALWIPAIRAMRIDPVGTLKAE